jgi:hypothetical protein
MSITRRTFRSAEPHWHDLLEHTQGHHPPLSPSTRLDWATMFTSKHVRSGLPTPCANSFSAISARPAVCVARAGSERCERRRCPQSWSFSRAHQNRWRNRDPHPSRLAFFLVISERDRTASRGRPVTRCTLLVVCRESSGRPAPAEFCPMNLARSKKVRCALRKKDKLASVG